MSDSLPHYVETLIVGAGFSGIWAAVRLLQAHRSSFLLIDKIDDLGGVWNLNRYPGCACDIPSHLYSFSFEHNPDWTHMYSDRAQIQHYIKLCAQKYGVIPHLRLKTVLLEARWNEAAALWHAKVLFEGVEAIVDARFLVSAVGGLNVPKYPDIRGRERFVGSSCHSSYWDTSLDLCGKTVAVIGTGASAVQIVPRVAAVAHRLYVFQRTPSWILPKPQFQISPGWRKFMRFLPILMTLFCSLLYWLHEFTLLSFIGVKTLRKAGERLALSHMKKHIQDPELQAALTPKYDLGCKRLLLSNDFYRSVARENVEVVTGRIKEVREKCIVSCTGDNEEREQEVDVIVYATGFDPAEVRLNVKGRDGVELRKSDAATMMGVTKVGFPNFFMVLGANTGVGHNSMTVMIDAQVTYLMKCMTLVLTKCPPSTSIELRQETQDRFAEMLLRRFEGTVWLNGGCLSYYFLANTKDIVTLWPASTLEFWYRARYAAPLDYRFRRVLKGK